MGVYKDYILTMGKSWGRGLEMIFLVPASHWKKPLIPGLVGNVQKLKIRVQHGCGLS
jgi:hypothetical protein